MNAPATIKAPHPTDAERQLAEAFAARFSELPGNPDVATARDNAFHLVNSAGLPTRRVEEWHYTDLRRLLSSVPAFDPHADGRPAQMLLEHSAVAVVADGKALQADDNIEGVSFRPVAELLGDGSIAPVLKAAGPADVAAAINSAFVSDGWFVDIEAGAEIDVPLELQAVHGGGQAHVRFPVRVGAGAKALIVERQTGSGDAFVTSVSNLTLADDAEVTWILLQEQPEMMTHLGQFAATLGKGAKLTLFIMNAGGKLVRQDVRVRMEGEGGDFQMRCVNLLGGQSHTDVTMVLDHAAVGATSTEIVRNVVSGSALGVFQGQIRVAQHAQKTDARMACNSLLLSDEGSFLAKPELEIFADDVACGHGATVTEIDRDHLFYLMARGIPEADARRLLVKAFLAEIIEELENEELVAALEQRLDDWFAGHG